MFVWKDADAESRVLFIARTFGFITEAALLQICQGMTEEDISSLLERNAMIKMPSCITVENGEQKKIGYYIMTDATMSSNGADARAVTANLMIVRFILNHDKDNYEWMDGNELASLNNKAAKKSESILRNDRSRFYLRAVARAYGVDRNTGRKVLLTLVSKRLPKNEAHDKEVADLYEADDHYIMLV